MAYNREAYDLLEEAFKVLQTKKGSMAYAYMVGLLLPNVGMEDAQRIFKMISEMEVKK